MGEEWPFVSDIEQVQAHYEACRRNGCTHVLAEMLATRSFPGTKGTDRSFMQGRHLDGSQFDHLPKWVGEEYLRKAEAAKVNPVGKWYSGPLARYPGDPKAWVDSLNDVKRVAKERGATVTGAIDLEPPKYLEQPPPAPYRVAPDIVQSRLADQLADDADLRAASRARREDLEAALTAKLSGFYGERR